MEVLIFIHKKILKYVIFLPRTRVAARAALVLDPPLLEGDEKPDSRRGRVDPAGGEKRRKSATYLAGEGAEDHHGSPLYDLQARISGPCLVSVAKF